MLRGVDVQRGGLHGSSHHPASIAVGDHPLGDPGPEISCLVLLEVFVEVLLALHPLMHFSHGDGGKRLF